MEKPDGVAAAAEAAAVRLVLLETLHPCICIYPIYIPYIYTRYMYPTYISYIYLHARSSYTRVYSLMYGPGWVSLEHVLPSWHLLFNHVCFRGCGCSSHKRPFVGAFQGRSWSH